MRSLLLALVIALVPGDGGDGGFVNLPATERAAERGAFLLPDGSVAMAVAVAPIAGEPAIVFADGSILFCGDGVGTGILPSAVDPQLDFGWYGDESSDAARVLAGITPDELTRRIKRRSAAQVESEKRRLAQEIARQAMEAAEREAEAIVEGIKAENEDVSTEGQGPIVGGNDGGFSTSWKNAKGREHQVTTPIASDTPAGLRRAADKHQKRVDALMSVFPPVP